MKVQPLREGALQVQVVVPSRVVAPVIRGLVRRHTARVAPAEVPRHVVGVVLTEAEVCLLYTSPSPRDQRGSRMPSSA